MRYSYRLRPGASAVAVLMAEWGRCRWLWNEAVHQQRSGNKPTFAKLCKLLTRARATNGWLRDGSQVARQNQHTARLWAKRVVDNHAVIAVEDFKPRFLARSTMARKAADAAIGAAKRELIDRGTRAGRKVVLVPPAYTTMTCSGCATRAKSRIELHVRTFVCPSCGLILCRDVNAARNILATVERDRAGADGVRHSDASLRGMCSDAA